MRVAVLPPAVPGRDESAHVTTDSSPAPEGEPSEHSEPTLPDDVWDRFLSDSERDIRASAPKEPSARARHVARRLREEDERVAAEARRRPRRRRGSPGAATAWRSGATDEGERRVARRRRLRGALGVLLVVVLVLVALSPHGAWSLVRGHGWRTHGSAVPAPVRVAPAGAPQAAAAPATRR
jgi:hypothetical protein